MTLSTQPLPALGSPNSTEDPKIRSLLSEIQGIVNGNIDSSNVTDGSLVEADLAPALTARLGVGTSGRGKSIIAASESRTNTTYGTLPTPDKVTVTLPTDGLIMVAFQATWQETVSGAGRAAIFVGANQLKSVIQRSGIPVTNAAATNGATAGRDLAIATWPGGLLSTGANLAPNYGGDVTTGQAVGVFYDGISGGGLPAFEADTTVTSVGGAALAGGACSIFAAAGTYDVTIQYKSTSGIVYARGRKLWVWTVGF